MFVIFTDFVRFVTQQERSTLSQIIWACEDVAPCARRTMESKMRRLGASQHIISVLCKNQKEDEKKLFVPVRRKSTTASRTIDAEDNLDSHDSYSFNASRSQSITESFKQYEP